MVVNTISLTDDQSAETKALWLLKKQGFQAIQQPDLIAKKDGKWTVFEIKEKELFEPGPNFPHYGAGLNKSQLWLRMQLLKDLAWRTYLINFVPKTGEVYGAYLDELEKGIFYDSPKGIRIYPIENYTKVASGWILKN